MEKLFRKVYKPHSKKDLMLQLPDEYIDKEIEVIAFSVNEKDELNKGSREKLTMDEVERFFDNYRTDLSGFSFNRNDANDYE